MTSPQIILTLKGAGAMYCERCKIGTDHNWVCRAFNNSVGIDRLRLPACLAAEAELNRLKGEK